MSSTIEQQPIRRTIGRRQSRDGQPLTPLNGIIDEDDQTNARVRMPNRDGFVVMCPERAQR